MYLIIIDSFSKWLEIIPTESATAEVTIKALREVMSRWGLPLMLVSDNGPCFTSYELLNFVNITTSNTSRYHHTTQRQTVWQREPFKYSKGVLKNFQVLLMTISHTSYCITVPHHKTLQENLLHF